MGLLVGALLAAVVVGGLLGGRIGRLAAVPVRRQALLVGALLAQIGGGFLTPVVGGSAYVVGLAASAVLALCFLSLNRRLPGVLLVAAGLGLNAVVVLLNGAMPVSTAAAKQAGVPLAAVASGGDPRHEIAGPGTTMRPLGDVIPVPWPVRPEVVSPGDVVVAAGLGYFVVAGMRRAPRRYRPGLVANGTVAARRRPAVAADPPRPAG